MLIYISKYLLYHNHTRVNNTPSNDISWVQRHQRNDAKYQYNETMKL